MNGNGLPANYGIILLGTGVVTLLYLGLQLYGFVLREFLPSWLAVSFRGVIYVGFFALFIVSAWLSIRYSKTESLWLHIPFLSCLGAILISVFLPLRDFRLHQNFKRYLGARTEIVRQIASGELFREPGDKDKITALPARYRHLSAGGGEVLVEQTGGITYILFFVNRGILDNFSGFVYKSDSAFLTRDDMLGGFVKIEKMTNHWYYVEST